MAKHRKSKPKNKRVRFSKERVQKDRSKSKSRETSKDNDDRENRMTTQDETKTQEVESKWEKLVYYYLARLKGLCDWRSSSQAPPVSRSNSAKSFKSVNSDNLEARVCKNVMNHSVPKPQKYWSRTKKIKKRKSKNDLGTYMAAGYQEGKQSAAKIVTRALKYGLLTGILKKDGNSYKIRSKYLGWNPIPESSKSEVSINRRSWCPSSTIELNQTQSKTKRKVPKGNSISRSQSSVNRNKSSSYERKSNKSYETIKSRRRLNGSSRSVSRSSKASRASRKSARDMGSINSLSNCDLCKFDHD